MPHYKNNNILGYNIPNPIRLLIKINISNVKYYTEHDSTKQIYALIIKL